MGSANRDFLGIGTVPCKASDEKDGGGTAGNPFMQFGKSNAKVYVESTTGITFNDVAGKMRQKNC